MPNFSGHKYKKLIVESGDIKKVAYYIANVDALFDMGYFAKSKGKTPKCEWAEHLIPEKDKELVDHQQIFYIVRSVNGDVLEKREQVFGIPEKPKVRKRVRVRHEPEQQKPRVRRRTRRTA